MTSSTPTLRALFDAQHRASRAQIDVPLALRRKRLLRIRRLLDEHGTALAAAVQADFGVRSLQLTEIADLFVLRTLLSHTLKSLSKWVKPVKVSTPLYLQPSRAYLQRQPLGVVGVVSPWNYPVQLALAPAITALAAGNRVMLKPSELTPRTSALMAELIGQAFAADEFCVVQGDAALAAAFTSLPFDHLVFTGSTATGRKVAEAAAANLTPTTLELGGKSPCIVDASCDMDSAAIKIAHGKLLNAGQTCIAPDYALVPRAQVDAFVAAVGEAARKLYPAIEANDDYTSIINARHHRRLLDLVADAQAKGARVIALGDAADAADAASAGSRKLPPTLLVGVNDTMAVMQEEIFGPLLPVEAYDTMDEAVARINARPHPLAFYYFGRDGARCGKVLEQTIAGGVTVNDTLWHFAHDGLPFGGVGASGIGAYHGEASFLTFTHSKPVFTQPRFAAASLLYPPYGKTYERVLELLRRLNG